MGTTLVKSNFIIGTATTRRCAFKDGENFLQYRYAYAKNYHHSLRVTRNSTESKIIRFCVAIDEEMPRFQDENGF
jgi:hypothetical protein